MKKIILTIKQTEFIISMLRQGKYQFEQGCMYDQWEESMLESHCGKSEVKRTWATFKEFGKAIKILKDKTTEESK